MKKTFALLLLLVSFSLVSQTELPYKEIDSLILKGRYKEALYKLNSFDNSLLKNTTIASIYYQLDKTKQAIVYYEKALEINDDYKTKVLIGKAYQKTKNYNKAIEIYEGIVKDDPQNLLIKYQLGKLYLSKRKAKKAIKTFEELYVVDKSNANYSYQKAIAFAMVNERNKMIDSFLEAFETDSTHVKSIYQLANSYYKLKDTDSTNIFLNKGLALESNHINLNKLIVNQSYRQKRYKETLKTLKKLDSLTPNQVFVINMFGRTYYNIGEYEKAKEYFEISKEFDRKNFKTYTYLGHIEMKLENYLKAQLNYRIATFIGKIPDKRDEEYYGIGHANLKLKKPKEAIVMFGIAYKENKGNHKALFQLAQTSDDYYKEKKKAYEHYSQYISQFERMDPELTAFVKRRIKEIKKDYFLRGEKLED